METTDPMEDIRRAQDGVREADEKAKQLAKEIKDAARINLGHAINRARDAGTKQTDIAEELGLNREQVRRLQVAARNAAKKKEA